MRATTNAPTSLIASTICLRLSLRRSRLSDVDEEEEWSFESSGRSSDISLLRTSDVDELRRIEPDSEDSGPILEPIVLPPEFDVPETGLRLERRSRPSQRTRRDLQRIRDDNRDVRRSQDESDRVSRRDLGPQREVVSVKTQPPTERLAPSSNPTI